MVFIDMKKKLLIIIIGLFVILFVVYLILNYKDPNRPFKTIELSGGNLIQNNTYPPYYDTVLSVAMDRMGMVGNHVIVSKLSDVAKSQFDGELKAHIRYHNKTFYLFVIDMNKSESIEVLSHEVIHMHQYTTGNLVYDGKVVWMGEVFDLNSQEYEVRPWEKDAFNRQGKLINEVKEVLWVE